MVLHEQGVLWNIGSKDIHFAQTDGKTSPDRGRTWLTAVASLQDLAINVSLNLFQLVICRDKAILGICKESKVRWELLNEDCDFPRLCLTCVHVNSFEEVLHDDAFGRLRPISDPLASRH